MKGFMTIVNLNCKLLLRNKGYLCCLFLIPIIAVAIMKLDATFANYDTTQSDNVLTWKGNGSAVNIEASMLSVKIIDCSQSEESNYLIQCLGQIGLYKIYVQKLHGLDYDKVLKSAKKTIESSSIKAVVIIPQEYGNFGDDNEVSTIKIIKGYEDLRVSLLQNDIDWYSKFLEQAQIEAKNSKMDTQIVLKEKLEQLGTKNIVQLQQMDTINLSKENEKIRYEIGYALAFLSVSFIFSGVFIAGVVIQEKDNRLLSRMRLSLMTSGGYINVKLILILVTTVIQVSVFAIGLGFVMGTDLGIPYLSLLSMLFILGVLFNFLSVVLGMLINNLISVTYVSFLVWSVTTLLGGLYFPVVSGTNFDKISKLTPQRWFMKSVELYMAKEKEAFIQFSLIAATFLIIMFTIGMIGIRLQDKE